jgi:hypothetical protein
MLVFLADAEAEASRLSKQCINIKPIKLDKDLLINLCSIDGAILIDLNGYVHAKGVILDGIVGLEGDSSRGSRYNSALTYQEYRGWQKPTMIIVHSEDGMVDVIPKLMPQIKHEFILEKIALLEKLSSPISFDRVTFYSTMRLLENRAFYLTDEECNKINSLKTLLESLDKTIGENQMWLTFEDFKPNLMMNEKYYDV